MKPRQEGHTEFAQDYLFQFFLFLQIRKLKKDQMTEAEQTQVTEAKESEAQNKKLGLTDFDESELDTHKDLEQALKEEGDFLLEMMPLFHLPDLDANTQVTTHPQARAYKEQTPNLPTLDFNLTVVQDSQQNNFPHEYLDLLDGINHPDPAVKVRESAEFSARWQSLWTDEQKEELDSSEGTQSEETTEAKYLEELNKLRDSFFNFYNLILKNGKKTSEVYENYSNMDNKFKFSTLFSQNLPTLEPIHVEMMWFLLAIEKLEERFGRNHKTVAWKHFVEGLRTLDEDIPVLRSQL